MIDTLHLNLRDFEVDVKHALKIQGETTDHGTGEVTGNGVLFRNSGGETRGAEAVYKLSPNFKFTIKPYPSGEVWAIATFSAAKMGRGDNYQPADAETLKQAYKALQADLISIGIKTNVEKATLARVDATKNIHTEESYSSYLPMLAALPCRLKDKWFYGSSLLLKNGQQEIGIYDKLSEMLAHKRKITGLPQTIRFEQRFKTGAKVKDYLGIPNALELANNLDHVAARYKDSLETYIFKLDTFDFKSTSKQQFVDELNFFKGSSRFGVSSYLELCGYRGISNSEDAFLEAVAEVYENRATISNAKKKLHALKIQAMSLETPAKNCKTSGQLYEELKNKVLS